MTDPVCAFVISARINEEERRAPEEYFWAERDPRVARSSQPLGWYDVIPLGLFEMGKAQCGMFNGQGCGTRKSQSDFKSKISNFKAA